MSKDDFIKICSRYKGEIVENERTQFMNENIINGEKVLCIFEVSEDGRLDGWESTYELIGGFGFPQANEEVLIRELEHYNFVKKEYEQLSLF